MRKKKQTEWFRNCPICDKLLTVHTKQQFIRATTNNTSCMSCVRKKSAASEEGKKHHALMILKSKEYWQDPNREKRQDEIIKSQIPLTRKCPRCKKDLIYKNTHNFKKSSKNNSFCKSCRGKVTWGTQEGKQKISNILKKAWALNEQGRKDISERNIKRWNNLSDEDKQKSISIMVSASAAIPKDQRKFRVVSLSTRKNLSLVLKEKWKDISFRNKQLENMCSRRSNLIGAGPMPGTSMLEFNVFEKLKHLNFIHQGRVDGFCVDLVNHELKIVIEVNGDFWHANPKIFDACWINNMNKKSAQEIWDRDYKRESKIKNAGYDVIVLWQREIQKGIDFVGIVNDYINNRELYTNLI